LNEAKFESIIKKGNFKSFIERNIRGGQILQYNKIDSRIYWREYTTVGRAIKKIKTGRQNMIL